MTGTDTLTDTGTASFEQLCRADLGGNSGGIRSRSPTIAGDHYGWLTCWNTPDDRC